MWLGSGDGRTVDAVVVELDILDDGLMAVRPGPVDVGDDAFPSLVGGRCVLGTPSISIAAVAATFAFLTASASDLASMVTLSKARSQKAILTTYSVMA